MAEIRIYRFGGVDVRVYDDAFRDISPEENKARLERLAGILKRQADKIRENGGGTGRDREGA